MRIGYFGGTFDPPHRGHLVVAQAARERFGLERVLFAPTGRQPLKPEGPAASFQDRMRMTELLCAEHACLEASAVDAPLADGAPNYTVDTLRRLRERLPTEAEVFAIVGADAFLGLPEWHRATELFTLADWIVVSRPGVSSQQLKATTLTPEEWARTHLMAGVADPASATHLRERLREGLSCADLLPNPVREYIRTHGLYAS